MTNHPSSFWRDKLLPYIACYVLFFVLLGLGMTVLFVWHDTVLALIAAFLGPLVAHMGTYMGSLTLLGLGVFMLVMAGEPYLRFGIARRQVGRRFLQLAVPLIIAIVLALLLHAWALSKLVP